MLRVADPLGGVTGARPASVRTPSWDRSPAIPEDRPGDGPPPAISPLAPRPSPLAPRPSPTTPHRPCRSNPRTTGRPGRGRRGRRRSRRGAWSDGAARRLRSVGRHALRARGPVVRGFQSPADRRVRAGSRTVPGPASSRWAAAGRTPVSPDGAVVASTGARGFPTGAPRPTRGRGGPVASSPGAAPTTSPVGLPWWIGTKPIARGPPTMPADAGPRAPSATGADAIPTIRPAPIAEGRTSPDPVPPERPPGPLRGP